MPIGVRAVNLHSLFTPEGTPKKQSSGLSHDYITEYSYGITESLNLIVPRLLGGSNGED